MPSKPGRFYGEAAHSATARCLSHPKDDPFIIIRRWQLAYTGGDACAAALLSLMEEWHNAHLRNRAEAAQRSGSVGSDGEPGGLDVTLLHAHTEEQLQLEVMIYGRVAIGAAVKKLVALGAVTLHRNPCARYRFDRTRYFLFHPEVVEKFLARYQEPFK